MSHHIPEPATLQEAAEYLRRAIKKALERGTRKDLKVVGDLSIRLANVANAQEQERLQRERTAAMTVRPSGAN